MDRRRHRPVLPDRLPVPGFMIRRILLWGALLLLGFGLWPDTLSLYRLTGEESWPGQLVGLGQWLYSATRPQPRLSAASPVAHTGVSPMGVNAFLEQEVLPDVRANSLALARSAGFRYVRQEFPWEDIEIHGKGDFVDRRNDLDGDGQPDPVDAWAKYDHIVALATQYELELIVRLGNPPSWSRVLTDTVGTQAPPDDFADYGDFVAAVVTRYAGRVRYFQLWNEPNIFPEWGAQPADPEAYTELLCTGYRRARAANPEAVILAAALSPTIQMGGPNMNDLVFLQRMYAAGSADCFDILSAQGYGLFSGPPDQRLRPTVINYPHNLYLRDIMVRHGDGAKPIWISEMGWNAAPESVPPIFGRVTEAQQARYAVEAYQRARREWPWVGVVNYWFLKRATDREQAEPFYYFRLLEPDFSPLPAYEALVAYAGSGLPPAESPAPLAFTRERSRPLFILVGGALLLFMVLQGLAPPGGYRP